MSTGVAATAVDAATLRRRAAAHARDLDERRLYLSVAELALRWGVSQTTVRDIPAAELPYLVFGQGAKLKRRRYERADVEAYERANRKAGGGGAR